jgi:enamine deaminase RidA (YjgF/YER057c/UK114 family)
VAESLGFDETGSTQRRRESSQMAKTQRAVTPPSMADEWISYKISPGVIAGNLLFVSGQIGDYGEDWIVKGAPEEQFVQAFEAIGEVLREAGAGFGDVIDMVTYHDGFEHIELFTEVKNRYFTEEPYPSWTGVGSAMLLPGALVEIKCTAVVGSHSADES